MVNKAAHLNMNKIKVKVWQLCKYTTSKGIWNAQDKISILEKKFCNGFRL